MTGLGAGHRTDRDNGDASWASYCPSSDGSLVAWKVGQEDDFMLQLFAVLLLLLATVYSSICFWGGAALRTHQRSSPRVRMACL